MAGFDAFCCFPEVSLLLIIIFVIVLGAERISAELRERLS